MNGTISRREFALSLGAAMLAGGCATANAKEATPGGIHVFSKMFQDITAGYDGCAEMLAAAGANGVQWTVRKKGHVLPENVTRDLPKAVKAAEKCGLKCASICTDITDASDPNAERVLKTAADCGISLYRMGYYLYDAKKESFTQSTDRFKRSFASLETLSRKVGIKATYQNHSSWGPALFGGAVWDIWACIRDLDPKYVGVEYDPMHAFYETNHSWSHGMELVMPWISAVDLKDFHWKLSPKNPKLIAKNMVAAGDGVTPWNEVKALLAKHGVKVPYIVHFEYKFDKENLVKTVKGELDTFRKIFG